MVTFHEHDGRISDERKQRLSGVKYPTVYYDPSPPSTLLSSFSFVLSLLPVYFLGPPPSAHPSSRSIEEQWRRSV